MQIPIAGMGAVKIGTAHSSVEFLMESRFKPTSSYQLQALILPKLTKVLPSTNFQVLDWSHLIGLELADPSFAEPSRIDLLLGADVYGSLLLGDIRHGPRGTPVAQQTSLGWVLSGSVNIDALTSPSILQS